jgi:hypothetical protein
LLLLHNLGTYIPSLGCNFALSMRFLLGHLIFKETVYNCNKEYGLLIITWEVSSRDDLFVLIKRLDEHNSFYITALYSLVTIWMGTKIL